MYGPDAETNCCARGSEGEEAQFPRRRRSKSLGGSGSRRDRSV